MSSIAFHRLGDMLSRTGLKLAFFAVVMFAFGYAMVPLYEKICQVTGLNNLLQPQAASGDFLPAADRLIRTEFDTNTHSSEVAMTPSMRIVELTPGKTYSVIYTLKNLTDQTLQTQAVPSFSPRRGDQWFKKIQCFCFDQLTLAPGEVRQAPVVFVIDPSIPREITTLSLSYTFFQVEGA